MQPWEVTRLAKRAWTRLLPRVFSTAPTHEWRDAALAACLWAGPDAVASHATAARLLGLNEFDTGAELHVRVPAMQRARSSTVIAHRRAAGHVLLVEGIPVTDVPDTLIDLMSLWPEDQARVPEYELKLACALDCAWRVDWHLLTRLEVRLEQDGASGRRHIAALRRLIADARVRGKPLESDLEVRTWLLLRRHGLPLPDVQVVVTDCEGLMRIDFLWGSRGFAVEADGFESHGDQEDFERDARRNTRLVALGLRVAHVTWDDVVRHPDETAARLARALGTCQPARRRPEIHEHEEVPHHLLQFVPRLH